MHRNFKHPHNSPVNWGKLGGKVTEGIIYVKEFQTKAPPPLMGEARWG